MASPNAPTDDFFIFLHAAGAWDVTLSLDPRNEEKGLVDPATTANTDETTIERWVSTGIALSDGGQSFKLVRPSNANSPLVFGPAIGDLLDLADRLTIINGLAMNTVSHPDGTSFVATGRHLAGGAPAASSTDVVLAHELGLSQIFPLFSVGGYPSAFLGTALDQRAIPLRVGSIGAAAKSVTRGTSSVTADDRKAVNQLLVDETNALAKRSYDPRPLNGLAMQFDSLQRLMNGPTADLFSETSLRKYEGFQLLDAKGNPIEPRFHADGKIAAAFAVNSFSKNLGRCISFTFGGFDTHNINYQNQAAIQQEAFNIITLLVKALDTTPHPTLAGKKLADHTHILVTSDFCRTPQINVTQGRDHQPNGSAVIISPRFKGGTVFGKSDPEQLLPLNAKKFADGERPVAPPDLLATLLSAVGVEPRKHMRDGDVLSEILR
jgi:uncharacterized protein (DUF1501 family)